MSTSNKDYDDDGDDDDDGVMARRRRLRVYGERFSSILAYLIRSVSVSKLRQYPAGYCTRFKQHTVSYYGLPYTIWQAIM